MLKRPPVIILSNIYWYSLWEWSQKLATSFANVGFQTVFVETTSIANPRIDADSARKIMKRLLHAGSSDKRLSDYPANVTVYTPLVAPPTYQVFRHLNRKIFVSKVVRDLRRLIDQDPVVMAFTPTQSTLDILSEIRPRLTWYHCASNYEAYPKAPSDIKRTERRLLELADVVTVDSGFLQEKHRNVRDDITRIEIGVDFELFNEVRTTSLEAPVQTVCFFGAMHKSKFDFDLVREVARAGFTVRLLGTLLDSAFAKVPGIEYRGEVSHQTLPVHLHSADALILPYKINAYSKGIFPAKTYECLATGKPIIATPLPDLLPLNKHVYIAEGSEKFVQVLRQLPELETPGEACARIELARKYSWDNQFRKFEEILRQSI